MPYTFILVEPLRLTHKNRKNIEQTSYFEKVAKSLIMHSERRRKYYFDRKLADIMRNRITKSLIEIEEEAY